MIGRLSRVEWSTDTLRSKTDKVAQTKCDSTQEAGSKVVKRVHELAGKYGVSMSNIALALQRAVGVTSPIVGATKAKYIDDAVAALDVELTDDDVQYLQELNVPHPVVGAA